MLVRRILACAIFGSFVLAAPFNQTIGVVNDKQKVSVHDKDRSLVPHRNYTEGAARNVSLYDDEYEVNWCVQGAKMVAAFFLYNYLMTPPPPRPPAPPPPPPVVPAEVMRRDSVRCLQVLQTRTVEGCSAKQWQASFGSCNCVAMFGSQVDNKGTGTSGLFQIMINAINEDGLRYKNAVVMEFGAGTPHLTGIGVSCSQDWTGLLGLFTQWQSGHGASGADERRSIDAKIGVRTIDEL
ncbi:hypothetical protein BGX34_004790 [Mortierella sp. NVP85]|nr:hypothetical protein BGX34_004790 [Mortierella sp. NVP85]